MSTRTIEFKANDIYEKCPKCGNNTRFKIRSEQAGEDYCEIWAECICSFDPTSPENLGSDHRVEDVWGGCSNENCYSAMAYAWNESIHKLNVKGNSDINRVCDEFEGGKG